ncbi:hypothetical protein DR864_29470 (plasmid) [Runella rosea]|uniref:Uncharacterized protein n=1 Tax=Runella rosea TaxID=2259595 RepID=A0A344TTM6_9BACT|nr:hypothetical protein DR864_29470 [Runella rosea]
MNFKSSEGTIQPHLSGAPPLTLLLAGEGDFKGFSYKPMRVGQLTADSELTLSNIRLLRIRVKG